MLTMARPGGSSGAWKPPFLSETRIPKQVVRAELSGDGECRADGVTVRSATPILSLCRRLIADGVHPDQRLVAYRGETLCVVVRSIANGARLLLNGKGTGFKRCRVPVGIAQPVRSNARRRDSQGRALGPVARALDLIADDEVQP